jgi:LmbE family N-acetylglucosaminyl deacetylase
MDDALRVLSVMAHQDDVEFNAGGTLLLLRRRLGAGVRIRLLTTTRGASGHHRLGLEETARRREVEARRSADLLGAEYACLRGLDGEHLPGQVFPDRNTLGGLWNEIRAFRPHVIFAPPLVTDPLAGIHIDHQHTAEAVRLVAYQVSVPHAYPVRGEAVEEMVVPPLVLTCDDPYAGRGNDAYDMAQDVSPVFDEKVRMARCHQSQILEWLPWVEDWPDGADESAWLERFRQRHRRINRRYGNPEEPFREYFRFTSWGREATSQDVTRLFPSETTLYGSRAIH